MTLRFDFSAGPGWDLGALAALDGAAVGAAVGDALREFEQGRRAPGAPAGAAEAARAERRIAELGVPRLFPLRPAYPALRMHPLPEWTVAGAHLRDAAVEVLAACVVERMRMLEPSQARMERWLEDKEVALHSAVSLALAGALDRIDGRVVVPLPLLAEALAVELRVMPDAQREALDRRAPGLLDHEDADEWVGMA